MPERKPGRPKTADAVVARRKALFLERFRELCLLNKTLKATKLAKTTFYRWKDADPEFKKEFEAAKVEAGDILEQEAIRRAYQGVEEPVFYQGKQVDSVTRYSDVLLIFLLKGLMPDRYSDRLRHSGDINLQGIEERLNAGRTRANKKKPDSVH